MQYSFDHKIMTELLNNFYDLTKARYCLYDTKGTVICSCGSQTGFCDLVTRLKRNGRILCQEDDMKNMAVASTDQKMMEPYVYRCFCGIINVIIPIRYDSDVCAYLVFGQILDENSIDRQWEVTCKALSWLKPHELDRLKDAFHALPRYSLRQILSCARIVETCTSYMYTKGSFSRSQLSEDELLKAIIHRDFAKPLTLDTIAAEMNVSKSKLCSIASRQGTTIISMLNEYRMRIASENLTESNRSVSGIAQEVGFNDYNYFTRLFKKQFGVSPREYRKQYKTQSDL